MVRTCYTDIDYVILKRFEKDDNTVLSAIYLKLKEQVDIILKLTLKIFGISETSSGTTKQTNK